MMVFLQKIVYQVLLATECIKWLIEQLLIFLSLGIWALFSRKKLHSSDENVFEAPYLMFLVVLVP